ncbi:hypothetical protein TNCV_3303451 [Trichonephila clavipes]|nr:hypothetical protein TNCV_3303451 [Trichonephila clavipes]
MVKRQRATKKVMHAIFFRSTGLIKVIKLEGQKTVAENWYTSKCLPEILQEVNSLNLEMGSGISRQIWKREIINLDDPDHDNGTKSLN